MVCFLTAQRFSWNVFKISLISILSPWPWTFFWLLHQNRMPWFLPHLALWCHLIVIIFIHIYTSVQCVYFTRLQSSESKVILFRPTVWLWGDNLSVRWRPHKPAGTARWLPLMLDEIWLLAGWMAALPDEQRSTKERLCECGPPCSADSQNPPRTSFPPSPHPQFLPFTLPLCCTEPYHKPSKRLGDVTTALVWFIQLVEAAAQRDCGHHHTQLLRSRVPDLCRYAGCLWAVVVSGREVTRGERKK